LRGNGITPGVIFGKEIHIPGIPYAQKSRGDRMVAPAAGLCQTVPYSISFSICAIAESRASTIASISSFVVVSMGATATFSNIALA